MTVSSNKVLSKKSFSKLFTLICDVLLYIMSPYSISDNTIVLNILILASKVIYFLIFDNTYDIWEINCFMSVMCLVKLRSSPYRPIARIYLLIY